MKSNITQNIVDRLNKQHHLVQNHPVGIIKEKILAILGDDVDVFDKELPIVSVQQNFDDLLIPKDHPSRAGTDTYYLSDDWVIRTHMTAHLSTLAKKSSFYIDCGSVARKDTIDATHFPVFTQMDSYRETDNPKKDLIRDLSAIIEGLFPGRDYRFSEDYFPFTVDSIEAEVKFGDKWVEILGGGVVQQKIMENIGKGDRKAYAYGLGLDRLAMILFEIPDIRLLWSEDERFTSQFKDGTITKFEPFSDYPPCKKDISFWIAESEETDGSWSRYNDFCEMLRGHAGTIVESVDLIDAFKHPIKGLSNCFRITYRSPERSLTNEEINNIQANVRKDTEALFDVQLR